jgi:hypothetical protein
MRWRQSRRRVQGDCGARAERKCKRRWRAREEWKEEKGGSVRHGSRKEGKQWRQLRPVTSAWFPSFLSLFSYTGVKLGCVCRRFPFTLQSSVGLGDAVEEGRGYEQGRLQLIKTGPCRFYRLVQYKSICNVADLE